MLKYINREHTLILFNGGVTWLAAPDDWDSIGDGPTREAVKAWLAAGNTPEPFPPPTTEDRVAANVAAIQAELDRQARLKGYDDIVSACSYASGDADDPFQAEGKKFLKWRGQVWAQAYAVLAEVQAGQRALPTPEEAVASMPTLVLP